MEITRSEMLATVVRKEQYPPAGPPEIAFAGRSNVGKSSLLNLITNRRHLAKVSGNPGKTRTINFFAINGDRFRIVDLPGYGYARVAKDISAQWGKMIETYLSGRDSLKGVCMLVDIRHEPTGQDRQLHDYLSYHDIPTLIVATKADKVSSNERTRQLNIIRKKFGMDDNEKIVCVSALKHTGVIEFLDAIEDMMGKTG